MKTFLKYALILALICMICVFGLTGIYSLAREDIAKRKAEKVARALDYVLGEGHGFRGKLSEWEHKDPKRVIRVRYYDGGERGMAVEIGEPGYGDVIRLMVGIAPDNRIKGIYILEHKETPGLGARIREEKVSKTWVSMIAGLFGGSEGEGEAPGTKEAGKKEQKIYWFQEQYRGKTLNQLTVRKDVTTPGDDYIMAITGATITSEAVTRATIKAALIAQEIRKHKDK